MRKRILMAASLLLFICRAFSGCQDGGKGEQDDGNDLVEIIGDPDITEPLPDMPSEDVAETSEMDLPADMADVDGDVEEEDGTPDPCPRLPGPADRIRKVVVSHPYDESGNPADTYEVLNLSTDGILTQTGTTFSMGRAFMGEIIFTPDGEVGIVVQDDDGTLGVFKFNSSGEPEVIHIGFSGDFYAARVVLDPSGSRIYILDSQWREHGGGIYSARINCDGSLLYEGQLAASQLPYVLNFLPSDPGRAVVAAEDILTSTAGHDVHLLQWGTDPALLAGVDAFPDDEQIVSSSTITADSRYALFGDNSLFSGIDNRVAVVEIVGDSLRAAQTLTPIEDPMAIVASPHNNAALVVSGFGNAVFTFDYNPADTVSPFVLRGELDYNGEPPQLPAAAVMISRGGLNGRVLIAENLGVRQVHFFPDARVSDYGLTSLGSGFTAMTGAIGVQP